MRELLTRFRFSTDETQLRRYQRGVDTFRDHADAAADSFRNMFAAFLGFGALQSIAKTADQMQSLEARVGELPQTVMATADAFDVVTSRATAARQSIDAYTNFYIKLQHAGKDFIKTQEEGLQVTDTISKALILGGATAQEQASTLLQFGQAIGSNVLQGDEFRALAESAPQLVDAIGKQLGIARLDLKQYASEGKLTSKAVIEAVKGISTEFDDRFKRMPLTIGTATTIIGNRWAVFINRLNRESSAVTKIANFFIKGFDRIEGALASMVEFFGGATNTLKFFGIALAAALSPLVFKLAAGAIAFLLSPLGLLIGALLLAGLAIEDFYQWMTGGTSVFQQWFGNFDDAKAKLDEFSGWITAAKIVVVSAVGVMVLNWIWAAGVAVTSAALTAGAWVKGLAQFGLAMAQNLVAVGAWVVRMVAQAAVVLWAWMGTFSLILEGMLSWVAGMLLSLAGLVAGWVSSFVAMAIAAAPVILTILGIVAAVGLVVAAIFFLLDNWRNIFDILVGIALMDWDRVAKGFSGMVDKLKGYWNAFKSFFGMKVDATVGAASAEPDKPNSGLVPNLVRPAQPAVTPATAASAASSPSGVPVAGGNSSVVIKIDQTLPPGTSAETAQAARDAVNQAFNALPIDRLARQMGQVGG